MTKGPAADRPFPIHLLWEPDAEVRRDLARRLDARVRTTWGDEPPDPARFEVLVAGRPTREQLLASPALRVLLIPYAGLPPETRELLREHPSIAVHNLHHNAAPTTEMALALLLAAAKRVVPFDRALRAGTWAGRGRRSPAVLLEGRTALLVGFGAIGRRLAPVLRALGLEVVATRARTEELERIEGTTVHPASMLRELLPGAEVVVVCAPLTDGTRGLLGREELARLPRGAVLVNVARGPVVDEDALYEALVDDRVGAAGLDVWWRYPGREGNPKATPPSGRPFHELENVVLSPHRSGSVLETEELRMRDLARSLNALARGEEPPGRVDLELGY
jgi:phosphoglycerate dehydrogenase-like enzyme